MFEAFYWMFKTRNIKAHFTYLLSVVLVCCVFSVILAILTSNFPMYQSMLSIAVMISILIPIFTLLGYFWNLTECVIDRKYDISSASVFNGRLKQVYTIELPEFSTVRFMWRGIASIVASAILTLPMFFMFNLSLNSMQVFNQSIYIAISIFICMFIPALLWNYAKNDSVFSVLNFPKAVYIIGNYTGKYFLNAIIFIIFSFVLSFITNCFYLVSGLNALSPEEILGGTKFLNIVFVTVITCIINIYSIFVNAYLLGTIAPPDER